MTEKETLAVLWEIAQKLAEEEPTYDTCMGDIECVYCGGHFTMIDSIFKHEPSCIVLKARALVAQDTQQSH